MSEDAGEKTEAPTAKRREQAAERGTIARSQDLASAAILVGAMLLLNSFGPGVIAAMRTLVVEMLGGESMSDFSTEGAVRGLIRGILLAAHALLPLLVGLAIIATAANLLQTGFRFDPTRLQPNFAALNPFNGFWRIFGGRNPIRGLIAGVKFAGIAWVAFYAVRDRIPLIVEAPGMEFLQVFHLGASIVYAVALRIGVALLILAVLEYVYQRWKIEQELKMSKQEVKEEMRGMEGDPKIKARRRQIALQIAKNRLKKDVPTADVVVTNPTEFAIALKYDPATMHAPRVIAKGQGTMAAQIRQIAVASGIPILERKPLARALYKLVEVGHDIPEQFYSAVAEILAYVYELTGKSKRKVLM